MSGGDFVPVAKFDDVKENTISPVTVVGRSLLLIKHDGQVYCVASRCPHMGCSLASGKLNGYILTCPCHGWSFDIRNGQYQSNKSIVLATYECKVENGQVLMRMFDDF